MGKIFMVKDNQIYLQFPFHFPVIIIHTNVSSLSIVDYYIGEEKTA